MNGIVSAAGFGNRADIANLNGIGVGLGKDCLADALRRADIGFLGSVRLPVRRGGNHAADMENIVRTGDGF